MERCWKNRDKGKRKFWEKSQVVHGKFQWTDQETNPILLGKRQATNYLLKAKSEMYCFQSFNSYPTENKLCLH
jgi:hypothetical protein